MDRLTDIAIAVAALAFLAGLAITATSGSARQVKVFLAWLSGIFGVVTIAGLIVSKGLLIYLVFQLFTLLTVVVILVVLGAVCGGGIYLLRHHQPRGRCLSQSDLGDYLPAAEFATLEGISEERALARITSSYYRGGLYGGAWYIHTSELSTAKS